MSACATRRGTSFPNDGQVMTRSPVSPTIPFDRDGVHHGYLRIPHSRDDSAWGSVMVPISIVKNGEGPTALLTGGNHGDEYEGPIALQELASNLQADQINGRVIIMPMMNLPAFQAGVRCSPIDGVNMNRAFPGNAGGTLTQKLVHFIATELVPLADFVLDFHSGGKTLDFLPFAGVHVLDDKGQQARCVAAMRAFNAPYSCQMLEIDNVGMFDTEVERQGKTFVTTELGGGGTASTATIGIAKKGVRNLLIHAGILVGDLQLAPTVHLEMPDETCFIFSSHSGLVEFKFDLGDVVNEGDVIARVWSMDRTGEAPVDYQARRGGLLTGRHAPGLIKVGDFVCLIADVIETGEPV